MDSDIAIKIDNVSKAYSLRQSKNDEDGNLTNTHWALKNISFEIKKGDSVGIIGPNGSGKSTLLKLLAGVTKPTSGTISIRGKVASILDIGAGFHPELSGRENVFLNGQIHGFSHKEISDKFTEIVEFSGIHSFIDEPVKNYSNGMYLRLAFSIMAHLNFDVYLLDEVLTVGDAAFSLKINKKLDDLHRNRKTRILVSHNINELQSLEKYVFLKDGELKEYNANNSVLNTYIEDVLSKSNGQTRVTQNYSLSDFSTFSQSNDFSVISLSFTQEGNAPFISSKAFQLSLSIAKHSAEINLDFVVIISDIHNNSVLSTSPMLTTISSMEEDTTHSFTCTIPPHIFGFQTYKLSLLFFTGLTKELSTNMVLDAFNPVHKMENVIQFKCELDLPNKTINFQDFNLNGGILPVFNWTKR